MAYVLAAWVLLLLTALLVSVLTGRVRIRACCSADPAKDFRMRGARAAIAIDSSWLRPRGRSIGLTQRFGGGPVRG